MDLQSSNPEHGFQFPGQFELCAMGAAGAGLERELPDCLREAGIAVIDGGVSSTLSSSGKYVSVRVRFHARDRDEHERAHALLRAHPAVKWTL